MNEALFSETETYSGTAAQNTYYSLDVTGALTKTDADGCIRYEPIQILSGELILKSDSVTDCIIQFPIHLYDALKTRFDRHPKKWQLLQNTAPLDIIYDMSGCHDSVLGRCKDCQGKEHQNLYGKVLIRVRDEG